MGSNAGISNLAVYKVMISTNPDIYYLHLKLNYLRKGSNLFQIHISVQDLHGALT